MKSQPSTKELLIIRVISYSFLAWAVTYVYLNSWTGLNINKLEQERMDRIEKKAALKKSLDVLVEAGFSDKEVVLKQIEMLNYFMSEKELDETQTILLTMEKTLAASTSLDAKERIASYSILIVGLQFLSNFDKAAEIADLCMNELKQSLSKKQISQVEFDKLTGTIVNNAAVNKYLQSGNADNLSAKQKMLAACIADFTKSNKLFGAANDASLQKIANQNLASARREIVFEKY